jgi:hypothetical protein
LYIIKRLIEILKLLEVEVKVAVVAVVAVEERKVALAVIHLNLKNVIKRAGSVGAVRLDV